jgi:hypothetical protein
MEDSDERLDALGTTNLPQSICCTSAHDYIGVT